MSDPAPGVPYAEREARRALLLDALTALPGARDADMAANDVVRALDHYLEAGDPDAGPGDRQIRDRLRNSVAHLGRSSDPPRDAGSAMVALDDYIASAPGRRAPRETAVTDFTNPAGGEIRWVRWLVLLLAIMVTTVVAVTFSGGWVAGGIIVAIWVVALFALGTT
jgi:hypothetical protein